LIIDSEAEKRRQRTIAIVKAYPLILLVIGIVVNLLVFGVDPFAVALPSTESVDALVVAAILLAINHTWLMTTTALTRARFRIHSTPEEWAASGTSPEDVSREGFRELERRHNAHRNSTENTIYFILLALILVFISPTAFAAQVWIVGFAVARLGYTYGYLAGKDGARYFFMSLSLLAMYGIASYLAVSLIL
jgi:uncharacterized MAPEG superfamily protein